MLLWSLSDILAAHDPDPEAMQQKLMDAMLQRAEQWNEEEKERADRRRRNRLARERKLICQ